MSLPLWLTRWRGSPLTADQAARRERLPAPQAIDDTPLEQLRLVVMDLETSGLNIQRDQILSVGAVVIEQAAIDLGSQYECTLYRAGHRVSESILIHGIAPSAIERGVAPEDALLDFMEFAGHCLFVAFHAPFDQRMLSRGLRKDLGHRLQHRFIDVAELAPMLFPEARVGRGGLDDWQQWFGLHNSQRHNAAADALATAEIMLILLSKARREGLHTLQQLHSRLGHWRRLKLARGA